MGIFSKKVSPSQNNNLTLRNLNDEKSLPHGAYVDAQAMEEGRGTSTVAGPAPVTAAAATTTVSNKKGAPTMATMPGAYAVPGPPPDVRAATSYAPAPPNYVPPGQNMAMGNISNPPQQQQKMSAPWMDSAKQYFNEATTTTRTEDMAMPEMATTRNPMMVACCPQCHQETRTKVQTYPSLWTWVAFIVTLVLFWPLCWVPLVLEQAKTTDHICVLCNSLIARVKPFQDCCVETRS